MVPASGTRPKLAAACASLLERSPAASSALKTAETRTDGSCVEVTSKCVALKLMGRLFSCLLIFDPCQVHRQHYSGTKSLATQIVARTIP